MVYVNVRTLSGKTYIIDEENVDTLKKLKKVLEEKSEIPYYSQRIILAGKILMNENILELKLEQYACIYLIPLDSFIFHERSADKNVGYGIYEYVRNKNNYTYLSKIENWRRILSNSYITPFRFEFKSYNSVNHAFYSKMFKNIDNTFSHELCLESNSDISKQDGSVVKKIVETKKFHPDNLLYWEVIQDKIMLEILLCKFKQCSIAREVLLSTRNAQLFNPRRFIIFNKQNFFIF